MSMRLLLAFAALGVPVVSLASSSTVPRWAATGVIAYKCGYAVCLMRPDGSGQRQLLSRGPSPQWDPSFSRDGRAIAFRAYFGLGDGEYALYTAKTNGCGVKRLTQSIAGNPTWAGGRWLVFDTSGAGQIWKVRSDGRGLALIASGGGANENVSPAWSPNGKTMAFVHFFHGRGQIWAMRSNGTGKRLLHADANASDESPSWSHDGRRIAFVGRTRASSWVESMNADGSQVSRLTHGPNSAWSPTWLPRDAGIAFVEGLLLSTGDLYVMRPDGSDAQKIASLATVQIAWADASLPRRSC